LVRFHDHQAIAMRRFLFRIASVKRFDPDQLVIDGGPKMHVARAGGHALDRHLILERQFGDGRDGSSRVIPHFDVVRESCDRMHVRVRRMNAFHQQ
jgi:hypothetical protein